MHQPSAEQEADPDRNWDALIVGGGPAGLSAALVLGRCRRRVLVCDDGHPRNAASRGLHGFLSRDGIEPGDLLAIARAQLAPYPGVVLRHSRVVAGERHHDGYLLHLEDGSRAQCRRLLIATGLKDRLPPVPGLAERYGRGVFHCPYCDGWEVRDRALVALGQGSAGLGLATSLRTWSADVAWCTGGGAEPGAQERERLEALGIDLLTAPVLAVEGDGGRLERIRFADGSTRPCDALFVHCAQEQASDLARDLGCELTAAAVVRTGRHRETGVPGLYVAGDAAQDTQLAIHAAAEGAAAAVAIDKELLAEEVDQRLAWARRRVPDGTGVPVE